MLNIKLDNFEGPLDLLLHLVEMKKMDIREITISNIIDEYLEIIKTHEKNNFKFKVEFLQMASELLEIKAYSVLRRDKNEEKITDLEKRIFEYKIYKQLAEEIAKTENQYYVRYTRKSNNVNNDKIIHEMSLLSKENIQLCLNNIFKKINKVDEYIIKINVEEEYSVEMAKEQIEALPYNITHSFSSLLNGKFSKSRIVAFFMAILELYKNDKINIIIKENDFFIIKEHKNV